jgi:hypothetical protein
MLVCGESVTTEGGLDRIRPQVGGVAVWGWIVPSDKQHLLVVRSRYEELQFTCTAFISACGLTQVGSLRHTRCPKHAHDPFWYSAAIKLGWCSTSAHSLQH